MHDQWCPTFTILGCLSKLWWIQGQFSPLPLWPKYRDWYQRTAFILLFTWVGVSGWCHFFWWTLLHCIERHYTVPSLFTVIIYIELLISSPAPPVPPLPSFPGWILLLWTCWTYSHLRKGLGYLKEPSLELASIMINSVVEYIWCLLFHVDFL